MPNITPIQWAAIAGAAILILWPIIAKSGGGLWERIKGMFKISGGGTSTDEPHDVLDDVVCLRKHFVDANEPEALKAIDDVITPAAVRVASKG